MLAAVQVCPNLTGSRRVWHTLRRIRRRYLSVKLAPRCAPYPGARRGSFSSVGASQLHAVDLGASGLNLYHNNSSNSDD